MEERVFEWKKYIYGYEINVLLSNGISFYTMFQGSGSP